MSENPVAVAQIRADLAAQDAENERLNDEAYEATNAAQAGERRSAVLRQLLELAERAYGEVPVEPIITAAPDPWTTDLSGMDAIDAMVMVLRASGTKMSLPEMAEAMLARGWTTRGKKPTDTLRMALRRDEHKKVVHSGERGYYVLGPGATEANQFEGWFKASTQTAISEPRGEGA